MTNFHTHTSRCGHAVGTVSDYVASAMEQSITDLGFSDHVPLPDDRWNIRMPYRELPEHLADLEQAAGEFREIRIYKGFECDFAPEYEGYFRDELLDYYGMDFLAGAVHFIPMDGEWLNCYHADDSRRSLHAYTDAVLRTIDCDLFSFIAHPDLFGVFYSRWDEEAQACSRAIIEHAALKHRTLEINSSGYRKELLETSAGSRYPYPLFEFWSLVSEYDIPVIVNSDAHKPEDVGAFGKAFELVASLGLKQCGIPKLR